MCRIHWIWPNFRAPENSSPAMRKEKWNEVQILFKLTSTCSQRSCFSQMSAISSRGSNAPKTVVPAVALTKNGAAPCGMTRHKREIVCIVQHFGECDTLNTIRPGNLGQVYPCLDFLFYVLSRKLQKNHLEKLCIIWIIPENMGYLRNRMSNIDSLNILAM